MQNHFDSESTQPSPRLPGPGVGDPRTGGMEMPEEDETTEVPFVDFLEEQEEQRVAVQPWAGIVRGSR